MYRPGGSGALAKRWLEDGVGGDLVEGMIFGGASGALLPGEEEAAIAAGEAGGGIKRQKRWWGGGVRVGWGWSDSRRRLRAGY